MGCRLGSESRRQSNVTCRSSLSLRKMKLQLLLNCIRHLLLLCRLYLLLKLSKLELLQEGIRI